MMTATVYLLLLDYKRLTDLFLNYTPVRASFAVQNKLLKTLSRLSIIFIPLLLILINESPNKNPELKGKYRVTRLIVNQTPIPLPACQDSVLTTIYFDLGNDCVFEYNNLKKRMYGSYTFDSKDGLIIKWHFRYRLKARHLKVILYPLMRTILTLTDPYISNRFLWPYKSFS